MVDNYDHCANESLAEKEKRVDGHRLQQLNDKLKQTSNDNTQNRSFKRHATSQTQKDSESDESFLFIDNRNNSSNGLKKQINQKRKIQRNDD
ncbi:unnamed protein product [Rotaria sp. Silwood2]|nr:unnamed protein product [Rotaria sp. Silwood2]